MLVVCGKLEKYEEEEEEEEKKKKKKKKKKEEEEEKEEKEEEVEEEEDVERECDDDSIELHKKIKFTEVESRNGTLYVLKTPVGDTKYRNITVECYALREFVRRVDCACKRLRSYIIENVIANSARLPPSTMPPCVLTFQRNSVLDYDDYDDYDDDYDHGDYYVDYVESSSRSYIDVSSKHR
uniref:Uncharacterized protein n=1 Tax=Vespula pensylvanica TaxID=30213 RepID=A0A834JR97_VESPE|nr:hypothetical protein H0235_017155 [Vespula pensylvanica]